MAYTKQTWTNLPSETTPFSAARMEHIEDGIYNVSTTTATTSSAGLMSALDKTRVNTWATSMFTTLWSGDLAATALNTNVTGRFETSDLRPYNYTLCFAHFNIDGIHFVLPFFNYGYATGITFCGHWGVSSSTYANLTLYYGGYDTFAFQVKDIAGKQVTQVHLLEIKALK